MPVSECLDLPEDRRSTCPIATTLDLLGDKWTLLVVRDLLFVGKRRFGELLESPEGIPTNILSDRLRRLEEHGVVEKSLYSSRPRRYEYRLTARGADLFPVLRAMAEWGLRHLPGTAAPPEEVLRKAYEGVRKGLEESTKAEEP
ncbi:MAG TPA: helix-turn-helix domain-containing protein [Thermoanaerobaculia bacterium]|nr:helix-turn-helix domain-containing protein [Thermoanaerobaculia bacterium]